ncbi:hypothetical protein, partial [Quisquiliibacterium transsilvanicum]|uniref:hypothetical protein n=1 Tax=Quisquiliibacterium transsilvanicum TaxID=1549638 RepID=UPI0031ED1200
LATAVVLNPICFGHHHVGDGRVDQAVVATAVTAVMTTAWSSRPGSASQAAACGIDKRAKSASA